MKNSWLLAAAVAASFVSAAQAPAQAATKFEFWHGLSGDLGERVQEACKKFNDSQKDLRSSAYRRTIMQRPCRNTIAAYRAKKQPAIAQIYDAGTLDMMLSKAFVPAKKLMADNGYKIDWSNYFPGIANYYATASGELLSFPFNSSTAVIYYNMSALEKAGVTAKPETGKMLQKPPRS